MQRSDEHSSDLAFQARALQGVSRTFALTIPVLPERLQAVVGNGYLLCRIADTLEDDPELSFATKHALYQEFLALLDGDAGRAGPWGERVAAILAPGTPRAERELFQEAERVLRITHGFNARQRAALGRCVAIMCRGMERFQEADHGRGLADVDELHEYCYYVAGVVGEMLTELFCDYSPAIEANRAALMQTTVSFGQGLQLTNILKDVWEDRARGFCWLPRAHFAEHGFDLDELAPGPLAPGYASGLGELIALAHRHLQDALDYTLAIPAHEHGIRKFCLWSLGMALLTLRKIHKHPGYQSGAEVKITRSSVRATNLTSDTLAGNDALLRLVFGWLSRGLAGGLSRGLSAHAHA